MRVGTPHFSDNDLPRFSRTTPLGKRRKSLAFFVVALGIISFFWPLITTDPPVLGKTQWSAWNVACQIYQGNLPNRKLSDTCERCDRQWVLALFYVPKLPTALYVLIVLALALLWLSRSATALALLGTMGAIASRLLAEALLARHMEPAHRRDFRWHAQPMRALVELSDNDAVYAAPDQSSDQSS